MKFSLHFPEADTSRFGVFKSYRRQIRSREKKERGTNNLGDSAKATGNVSGNVHVA